MIFFVSPFRLETNSELKHLKMDAWKMSGSILGRLGLCSGASYVGFWGRERGWLVG